MHSEWIPLYGYGAVAVGTFLEGEGALLGAALAVQQGVLAHRGVVLAAICGAMAGDQCFFWLGRLRSGHNLARYPRFAAKVERVACWVHRHRWAVLCGYRFVYGLRGVGPFALGMAGISWRLFTAMNVLTASVWAVLASSAGLWLGGVVRDPARVGWLAFVGVIIVGGMMGWRRWRRG